MRALSNARICAAAPSDGRARYWFSRGGFFWLSALLLIASLAFSAPHVFAAPDKIAVSAADLQLMPEADGSLQLDAQFEFELPPLLIDAVNRGIPLNFVVDFELYRERWYWFDKKVVGLSATYRLTYSPLTRQYRIARGAASAQSAQAAAYDSLPEALDALRSLRGWKVAERKQIRADDEYKAQLRMRLDTSQLPKPFQVNALTNRDWTLASDWRDVAVSVESAK